MKIGYLAMDWCDWIAFGEVSGCRTFFWRESIKRVEAVEGEMVWFTYDNLEGEEL